MSKVSRRDLKSALVGALHGLEQVADGLPIPGVKASVSGILRIIEQEELREANVETFRDLVGMIQKFHAVTVKQLPKNGNIPDDLLSAVRALAEDLEDIPAQYDKKIGEKSIVRRLKSFISAKEHAEALNSLGKRLNNAIDVFQTALLMSLRLADMKREANRLIDKLPVERKAFYNAHREHPIELCEPDTRVSLLDSVAKRAQDTGPNNPQILWLNGRAGVGKSTIAKTLATRFDDVKTLGASFMFSKPNGVADGSKVFPTLAYQLALHLPEFRDHLVSAIQADEASLEAEIPRQFEDLFAAPLAKLSKLGSPPLVIIILDALDECTSETLTPVLTAIVENTARFSFLRFVITSRPESPIRHVLERFPQQIHEVNMNDIPVSEDIAMYLRARLGRAYSRLVHKGNQNLAWPADKDLASLIDIAGNLFVFAATAVRFIGDERAAAPQRRLETILRGQPAGQKSPFSGLDIVYREILQNALSDSDDDVYKRFQTVVGTIVLSSKPFSVDSLAEFLAPSYDANDIRHSLKYLFSVLVVPDNDKESGLQVYHKSFADFITDPARCTLTEAYLHPPIHHARLCLRYLEMAESTFDTGALSAASGIEAKGQHDRIGKAAVPVVRVTSINLRCWLYHLHALTDQEKKGGQADELILSVSHRAQVLLEPLREYEHFIERNQTKSLISRLLHPFYEMMVRFRVIKETLTEGVEICRTQEL